MTRLLVPEMFGVMAVATMVSVLLGMLSDVGLRQNIVRSARGDDPAFLDTAWVLQILRGFVIWGIALLVSAALHLANLYGLVPGQSVYAAPELPPVIAVTSFSAVILGFQSTRVATADRRFDQMRLVRIELVAQIVALIVMIVLATLTRSIWALVAGGLVAALTTTILSHVALAGHVNRVRWDRGAAAELLDFGRWVAASSAITVLAATGDRLLLAGLLDPALMGLYAIAALIIRAVENLLQRVFAAVSLPALSEIARREPARLREVYYRMRRPADLAALFAAGLLFSSGSLVIGLLYDSRYAGAGTMLEILALSLFVARYGISHQLYLALGMPRYVALIQGVALVSLYGGLPLAYWLAGADGALWAIALHGFATLPLVYRFNARHGMLEPRREADVLLALPAGYLCGEALRSLAARLGVFA